MGLPEADLFAFGKKETITIKRLFHEFLYTVEFCLCIMKGGC